MLRYQKQGFLTDGHRANFQNNLDPLDQDPKHPSPVCDDSGVFLDELILSSPETHSKSAISHLQNITLHKYLPEDSSIMRQYSIHKSLDSDDDRSDDLGLASSSIDSADDLDGDPLPSTLQICPPAIPTRQKPPPVPARKSLPKSGINHKYNKFSFTESMSSLDVPTQIKPPLSKSSSSGEDSNFGEGDSFTNEDHISSFCLQENSKNASIQMRNDKSRNNFAMTRSFHENTLLNLQNENNLNQESKANFLAQTLSSSSPKKLDVLNVCNGVKTLKMNDNSSSFKWKSEECLRTATENKWSLPGRRYEKSVSVKDRIAMFSGMDSNQNPTKKDLQRYGSENNIKALNTIAESRKLDSSTTDDQKQNNLLRDSKWQSLHNISKKNSERDISYTNSNMKPALSVSSLISNSSSDSYSNNNYSPIPIKLEVEPPKPIISTYPETQLTNNKRYNYNGLYTVKTLKNTEDLLSRKAAGSNLLSIIDTRKQAMTKLKGLVIPEKPIPPDASKALPTIFSSDSECGKDRRASLPMTVVTTCKSMSLPRDRKPEYAQIQKQTSLTEPPWKNERSNHTNTLPKYAPTFKKGGLEIPGSSLSPSPPSSLTSPLSPPPSSPSSIASSNTGSTLQQNVFQFSLSHSKPVQPLLPEKAIMSPPSLPSDIEYEGDNSDNSSNSASPMRSVDRPNKESKANLSHGKLHYDKSNTFTSSVKSVPLQPLMVQTVSNSSSLEPPLPPPRAAICISKTEIHLKRDERRPSVPESLAPSEILKPNDAVDNRNIENTRKDIITKDYSSTDIKIYTASEAKNGLPDLLSSSHPTSQSQIQPKRRMLPLPQEDVENPLDVLAGKFRAFPLSLPDIKPMNGNSLVERSRGKNHSNFSSECYESDDDSYSTLSHRTEDSRHTTTDDCLSDATNDSFEKPRLILDVTTNLRSSNHDDYASTEGYLSDASTDVSLRRFTNRPLDASTEEYLSDATTESPDPDWVINRTSDSRYRNESIRNGSVGEKTVVVDLRPKCLSQQRTVLRASMAPPTGSVQKFKALAEKWEQRADVTSPPPPVVINTAVIPPKSVATMNTIFASTTTTANKGKSSLPPSLMPRSSSTEWKTSNVVPRLSSTMRSSNSQDSTRSSTPETNGWSSTAQETPSPMRRDSSSSSSGSSKSTLKDEADMCRPSSKDTAIKHAQPEHTVAVSNGHTAFNGKQDVDTWTNEPRNRRGIDLTRTDWSTRATNYNTKASVSDIRKSFESGSSNKETERPELPKKQSPKPQAAAVIRTSSPPVATAISAPPAPRRTPPIALQDEETQDENGHQLVADARRQLQQEGLDNRLVVLPVILRREGADGGSVGITLAGGADYEVKEITIHKVISGSIADRDGRVKKGDRIMSINGRDVRGVTHKEALHILKAPSPKVLLILARCSDLQPKENGTDESKRSSPTQVLNLRDSQTLLVELQKDATGVGFSIEGGKDSPQGDRPLLIKRVFKGGAADKDGQLEEGDEILAVNQHSVANMTRTEAWNFLKKLPEGPVQIQVKKAAMESVS